MKKLESKYLCKMSLINTLPETPEEDHMEADKLLCNLLIELGYPKVVAEYVKIDKHYSKEKL